MKKFVVHYKNYWADEEPTKVIYTIYGKDWPSVYEEVKSHIWSEEPDPKNRWSKPHRQEIDHYEEFEVEYREVYYFMSSEDVDVNEYKDCYGGTEYNDTIVDWRKSDYYDTFDECFLDWVKYSPERRTPIMKGTVEKL